MWTVLTEQVQLAQLAEELRREVESRPSPTSLRVYGCVRAVSVGLIPEEVVVDQWPDWRVVISRPSSRPHAQDSLPAFLPAVSVHTKDVQRLREILPIEGAIDWTRPFVFSSIPLSLTEVVAQWMAARGRLSRWINCDTLVANRETIGDRRPTLPSTYATSTIKPSMVSSITSNFYQRAGREGVEDGTSDTDNLIRFNIANLPSSGVLDATGQPAAHAMCHYFGAIGLLDVSRDHKGKGLGLFVLSDLARKLLAENLPLWAQVEADNKVAARLFLRAGFERMGGGIATWLEYTPNKETTDCACAVEAAPSDEKTDSSSARTSRIILEI